MNQNTSEDGLEIVRLRHEIADLRRRIVAKDNLIAEYRRLGQRVIDGDLRTAIEFESAAKTYDGSTGISAQAA